MITVHHLENSRSFRVVWLLEELGADYTVKQYPRDPKTNLAPKDFQRLHPLGKAPVVTDDDTALAETGAIVEYFLDKYVSAGLRPAAGSPGRQPYFYWMHAAEGSLMPLLTLGLFLNVMETRSPFFIRPMIKAVTGKLRQAYHTPSLAKQLAYADQTIGQSEWFTGDQFSGADIMMSYPLEAALSRTPDASKLSNIAKFADRIAKRPAYQRAVERVGQQTFFS